MTVTRNVVKDLVPLYLSGEASADTVRLVEDYMAGDPELARDVESARREDVGLPPTAPPTAEKTTLDATRRLLKTRTSTLVVAVLFTLLPWSFTFEGNRITFVVFRDAPIVAAAWWATAAVMWTWHVMVRRRLRVSGL